MIKILNHKFIYPSVQDYIIENSDTSLANLDRCIYCSSSYVEMTLNIDNRIIIESLVNSINVKEQLEILNKYHPCITEDEWIIKNIIE